MFYLIYAPGGVRCGAGGAIGMANGVLMATGPLRGGAHNLGPRRSPATLPAPLSHSKTM